MREIAKTDETKELERMIWNHANEQGIFGCFEVSIGWFGDERVDFMTYDTKGEIRCYEIKVSIQDFYSGAKKSFLGDFNYYVVTGKLLEKLRDKADRDYEEYKYLGISNDTKTRLFDTRLKNKGIGLMALNENGWLETIIKPKRKFVSVGNKAILIESLLRSSNREVKKFYRLKGYWE